MDAGPAHICGSYLFDIDRLCKDLRCVFFLQLIQGGTLQHQSRSQLQLHHCLMHLHL